VENITDIKIESSPYDGRDYSVEIVIPPLSVTVFKYV